VQPVLRWFRHGTCEVSPLSYYSPIDAFVFLEVAFLRVSTPKPRGRFSPSLIRSRALPLFFTATSAGSRVAHVSVVPWRGLRPIRHTGAPRCNVACDVTGVLFLTQRSADSWPSQLIAAVVFHRSYSSVGKVARLPTRLQL